MVLARFSLERYHDSRNLRLDTIGSPALGQGSNCKLVLVNLSYQINMGANLQGVLQVLINLHDSSLVTTSIAVVGCCHRVNFIPKLGVLNRDIPEKMVTTFRS